jgi:hypothetical protein
MADDPKAAQHEENPYLKMMQEDATGEAPAEAPSTAAPQPPAKPPLIGGVGETLRNAGSHIKNLVAGPAHAMADAPSDAVEQGISSSPLGQLGVGAYRMAVKPSVDSVRSAVEQGKKATSSVKTNTIRLAITHPLPSVAQSMQFRLPALGRATSRRKRTRRG